MEVDEPISPELVLVAPPELRARALSGLSDSEFSVHLERIRERGTRALVVQEPRPTAGRLLRVPIAAWFVISALTLALTLAADQLR